jgi:hypothetical protein
MIEDVLQLKLPLNSPRWAELWHMYGDASDVPAHLRKLRRVKTDAQLAEQLCSLMVGIYHQHDVTTAAFAVVPHFADLCLASTLPTCYRYIGCIAKIEVARRYHNGLGNKNSIVPGDLAAAYYGTVRSLSELIFECYDWKTGTWSGARFG